MKTILIALVALFSSTIVFSQDITGHWTGTMKDDASGNTLPYEVFITKEKGKYSGYSYNYVLSEGKKYYSIKKIKVNVAKDGKVVFLDDDLLENDLPEVDKELKQLNVLDITNATGGTALDGLYTTRIKKYYETTGKTNLKKVTTPIESTLMSYLKRINGANDITDMK